jgi:hypothetical protein
MFCHRSVPASMSAVALQGRSIRAYSALLTSKFDDIYQTVSLLRRSKFYLPDFPAEPPI